MSNLIISGKDSVTGQNREAELSDQFIDRTGTQVLATEASVAAAIAAASNTLNSLSEILGSSTDSNVTGGSDIVISEGDIIDFSNLSALRRQDWSYVFDNVTANVEGLVISRPNDSRDIIGFGIDDTLFLPGGGPAVALAGGTYFYWTDGNLDGNYVADLYALPSGDMAFSGFSFIFYEFGEIPPVNSGGINTVARLRMQDGIWDFGPSTLAFGTAIGANTATVQGVNGGITLTGVIFMDNSSYLSWDGDTEYLWRPSADMMELAAEAEIRLTAPILRVGTISSGSSIYLGNGPSLSFITVDTAVPAIRFWPGGTEKVRIGGSGDGVNVGINNIEFGSDLDTVIESLSHETWTGRNFGNADGLDIIVNGVDVLAIGTDAAIGGTNAFMAMPVNSYIGWTNSSDTGASIIASMGYYDAAGEPDNSWYVDAPILSFFESGTERLRIDNNAITLIESATLVIGDGTGASYIDLPGASYIQWRNQNTGIWSQQDKVLSLYADEPGGFIAFENDIHFTSGPPSYTSLVTIATDIYVENYGGDWEITGISIQPVGSPGVPLRIGSDPDGNTQLVLDSGSSGIHFADTTDDDKLLAEIRHRVSLPGLGYGAQVHSFFEFTAVGNSWAETERMRINNGIIDVGSHPLQFGSAIGTSESQIAWIDATNPYLDLTVMGNSIISLGDNEFGMFGTAPIIKQTVTGSHGGNAALISLLTALAAYGLITDSTTA